ncbi:MAG TPA: TRAP transporter small permease subunit [Desulfobacterales bacterium]|nr:TRAP transporter small permease subunit [Desulfobacterales bacterium]
MMRRAILAWIAWVDGLTERLGRLVSWCAFLLVILVCLDVGLRYLFALSFVAFRELEWHLFALLFLLGAASTLKRDGHVRVDVLYQRLGPRSRAAINVAGCLLFLFPGCYLVIATALPFVQQAWAIREGSPDPGGLPARYLLKGVIPAAFGLLALQGVAFFLRNLCVLFGVDCGRRRPGPQAGDGAAAGKRRAAGGGIS